MQLLEQAHNTSTVDWHPATSSLLFTQQDLDLFMKNWQMGSRLDIVDHGLGMILDKIQELLSGSSIVYMQDVKPFTRTGNPKYVLGLKLSQPNLLAPVTKLLHVNVFKADPTHDQIHKTSCVWDPSSLQLKFDQQALQEFANNWQIKITDPTDYTHLLGECVELIIQLLGELQRKQQQDYRLRSTFAIQFLKPPQNLQQILDKLKLKCN